MSLPTQVFLRASRNALGVSSIVLVIALLRLRLGDETLLVSLFRDRRGQPAPAESPVLEEEVPVRAEDLGVVLLLRVEGGAHREGEEVPEVLHVHVVPFRSAPAGHDGREAVLERELGHVVGLDAALVHGASAGAVDRGRAYDQCLHLLGVVGGQHDLVDISVIGVAWNTCDAVDVINVVAIPGSIQIRTKEFATGATHYFCSGSGSCPYLLLSQSYHCSMPVPQTWIQ